MNPLQEFLTQPLSFQGLRLIRLDLPQKEQFVSGIGVRNSREALLVVWEDADGVSGYGECSCRPDPYYSDEFIDGAIMMVQQFIVPHLSEIGTLGDLMTLLGRIRGWNFTKAAIEMAALDAIQKKTKKTPLELLDITPLTEVPVGISLGLYHDLEQMKMAVSNAISTGYRRLKFKIAPSVRTEFFDAINPILVDSKVAVGFDANGSLTQDHFHVLDYFVNTYGSMIEQPFAPGRFDLLLKAKKQFPEIFVCYDEEIKSLGDVMKLHHLEVLDEVNLKPGRVGGLLKSMEIVSYCRDHRIPCWIGGMFETGIGRIHNLKMASYLPNTSAHDLSPSDRYFLEDVVQPGIQMNAGFVDIQSLDACEIQPEIIEKYTTQQHHYTS
ncbi:MAG: o-succinylbenzoate synthase [Bacteroidota bacterium]